MIWFLNQIRMDHNWHNVKHCRSDENKWFTRNCELILILNRFNLFWMMFLFIFKLINVHSENIKMKWRFLVIICKALVPFSFLLLPINVVVLCKLRVCGDEHKSDNWCKPIQGMGTRLAFGAGLNQSWSESIRMTNNYIEVPVGNGCWRSLLSISMLIVHLCYSNIASLGGTDWRIWWMPLWSQVW